ncbi:MAG: PorV/PorQ family protein [Elusimicrobiaceae bacterium]|nr:PorV/PorQ family protein [Elusimicrobiaceae bacterium]
MTAPRNKINALVLSALLSAGGPAFAGAGTSAVSTLKLDGAARPLALGGAFAAVADDASAMFYNPSGIAQLDKKQILFTHTEWLAGVRTEYLACALPLTEKWTVGLGANFGFADDVSQYDASGNKSGSFGANEGYGLVNLAYQPFKNMAFGGSGKFIRQSVSDKNAAAYAFDLGAIFYNRLVRLGAAVQNAAGTKMKLATEEFPLPVTLRGGVTITPWNSLLATAEYVKPNDEDMSMRVGAEYVFGFEDGSAVEIPVRCGWRSGQSDGAGQGFALGLGIKTKDMSFDYAFMPCGDLGNAHKMTLAFKFGSARAGTTGLSQRFRRSPAEKNTDRFDREPEDPEILVLPE